MGVNEKVPIMVYLRSESIAKLVRYSRTYNLGYGDIVDKFMEQEIKIKGQDDEPKKTKTEPEAGAKLHSNNESVRSDDEYQRWGVRKEGIRDAYRSNRKDRVEKERR